MPFAKTIRNANEVTRHMIGLVTFTSPLRGKSSVKIGPCNIGLIERHKITIILESKGVKGEVRWMYR